MWPEFNPQYWHIRWFVVPQVGLLQVLQFQTSVSGHLYEAVSCVNVSILLTEKLNFNSKLASNKQTPVFKVKLCFVLWLAA